jgi:hypothetical protein
MLDRSLGLGMTARPGTELAITQAAQLATQRLGPRCLAVDQATQSIRIEPQHPVPNNLQPDIADTRRLASTAPIINLGQGQQPAGLSRIFRASRQTS